MPSCSDAQESLRLHHLFQDLMELQYGRSCRENGDRIQISCHRSLSHSQTLRLAPSHCYPQHHYLCLTPPPYNDVGARRTTVVPAESTNIRLWSMRVQTETSTLENASARIVQCGGN
ncbi:hypothetical protein SCLCIDRAFT_403813 [Scleroderma citrinum Foug A]|uniref:Uncharacterized protein n=1 Tax=Scleroderma citrinum Foug A TaxID=1036808 RepID=A0A0C3DCZ8_9AGAM|nr:hypothetical protein SCLCIDRAFT_403813 [Scleroderma citrinum Foug A]